LLHSVI